MRSVKKPALFTIENLPFIYHYEHHAMFRESIISGFYIDPQGKKFINNYDKNWKDFNRERQRLWWDGTRSTTNGVISSTDLFENLNNSNITKERLNPDRSNILITQEMLDDVRSSSISRIDNYRLIDVGLTTRSLFIYDQTNDLYKRIILTYFNEYLFVNDSIYTARIIGWMENNRWLEQRYNSPWNKDYHFPNILNRRNHHTGGKRYVNPLPWYWNVQQWIANIRSK